MVKQLLQRVGGAVGLEGPHLHLAEALAAELRLPTQRLLGDHGVRAGRAGVDLVVDQVGQLQDVDVADRDRVVVDLARAAVVEHGLAVGVDLHVAVGRVGVERPEDLLDRRVRPGVLGLVPVGAVEDRRGHPGCGLGPRAGLALRAVALGARSHALVDLHALPAVAGCVAQVRLEHLAHVHPARHAERVQDDVDRRPVRQVRHVLDRQDLGDDALVAVAAGQLVARADFGADPDDAALVEVLGGSPRTGWGCPW